MRQLGLITYKPEKAFQGYTLFAPMETTSVYLMDMRGQIVHRWEMEYRPGDYGYLLENGNLLAGQRRLGHGTGLSRRWACTPGRPGGQQRIGPGLRSGRRSLPGPRGRPRWRR